MHFSCKVIGVNAIVRNLERFHSKQLDRLAAQMDYICRMLVDFIKEEYSENRAAHGKGFTSRTHNLQNSIKHKVFRDKDNNAVVGYVYAGMMYALFVELGNGQAYAFLYPALMEKRNEIGKLFKNMKIAHGLEFRKL